MIGKLASDLFDIVAQCAAGPGEKDFKDIRKALSKIEKHLDEIEEEDFRYYAQDFVQKWQEKDSIESDFEVFASETNVLTVEFGNEGYFDEVDGEDDF